MSVRTIALLLAFTAVAAGRADEAVLPDGQRLEGKLTADAAGRFAFKVDGRSVPLTQLALVRFGDSAKRELDSATCRVTLTDGSSFAADVLKLDEKQLRARTGWAEELAIPRSAVASVVRPGGAARRDASDPGQDELWLTNGDQVFGTVPHADRAGLTLQVRLAKRSITWNDVRGLYLAERPAQPQTSDGEHVRLAFRSVRGEADEIEGVLRSLDERSATLSHSHLGEVKLDRGQLVRARGLLYGRRIEIDTARHHLGDPDSLSVTLFPRRAEGTTLRRTVRLAGKPPAARLLLDVTDLRTDARGRVELHVNGTSAADLTRLVDREVKEPRRVQVELPVKLLRAGANELELRLTPLRDSERHPSCGVSRLVLELPR